MYTCIIVAWPTIFTCVRVKILKICMSQSKIFQHLSFIPLLVHEIGNHNIFLSNPKLFFQIPCNSVWSSDIKVKITSLFPFLFLYPRVIISVNWDTYHIYIIFLIKPPYKPGRHNRVRGKSTPAWTVPGFSLWYWFRRVTCSMQLIW